MKKQILIKETIYESDSALRYLEDESVLESPSDESQLHKHVDYQLIVVTKGQIKGFVGDIFGLYPSGTIILIGRNVPHYFILDFNKREDDQKKNEIEILKFRYDLFPAKLNEFSELRFIYRLLKNSQHGVVFKSTKIFKKVRSILFRIDDINGIQKLNELYVLLDILGQNKNYEIASLQEYSADNALISGISPLQRTYNYLYANFRENISLDAVANYAHQNSSSLCRTFRRETGQTIFQFLNKIRIENACKLLVETDMNVSQVAYDSGFSNLPHFNKQFQIVKGKTPTEYRKLSKV